jgi:RNA polymerase sigma-70 factor (ECF subfamily)
VAATPGDSAIRAFEPGESTHDPSKLVLWGEFHRAVEALPDEEREAVDLLWYQELSQEEAAETLGVDKSTVKRRWRAARLKLAKALQHELPGEIGE